MMTRVQGRNWFRPINLFTNSVLVVNEKFYTYYDCYTNEDVSYKKYVILIAFPRQNWSRERASVLPYIHIACLACSEIHLKHINALFGQYAHMLMLKSWWYI